MKIIIGIFLLLIVVPVHSQDDVCDDLDPDQICFGQESVEIMVDCQFAPEFDTPDERASMESVCVVRTNQDGRAYMNLQSAFIAVLNDVEMQSISSGDVGSQTTLEDEVSVYSGPGSQYDIINTLAAGTEIYVNACNCTGNWLRIMQDDGSVGWLPSRRVKVDDTNLPEVDADDPIFTGMQAFTLVGDILIQMMNEPILLQINGVQLEATSTVFVRSKPGEIMTIDILDGQATLKANDRIFYVPSGGHVTIPLSEQSIPDENISVDLYTPQQIANIPLELLPEAINPMSFVDETKPTIVSVAQCSVISDTGEMPCPVQFINPDGDEIALMDVEFIYAAQGEWEGSQHTELDLLDGTFSAGTLGWDISCSLAGENFIGPVEWQIILEDSAGHRSLPFIADFNCIDG